MSTFITELTSSGTGPRLAVKDLIDVAGVPTTAGSRAVAREAKAAGRDAPLLSGFRRAGWRIVGKANLHELAFGTTGINPWFGTPTNPLDGNLVPGGSSSGSAVAVATEVADLALGSDTGGSIRIPAAFCGVCGLKTTFGRIDLEGVWPLARSLDTVGPMGRDVASLITGMSLLEEGFLPAGSPATTIGRLRLPSEQVDERIDEAVDAALTAAGFAIVEFVVPEWELAWSNCTDLLVSEAAEANRSLLDDPELAELLSVPVRDRLRSGASISAGRVGETRAFAANWRQQLDTLFQQVELLALPSVGCFAPPIEEATRASFNRLTNPINLAGLPAVSLPIPSTTELPASLQLVGPHLGEALLLASALVVESAVADDRQ